MARGNKRSSGGPNSNDTGARGTGSAGRGPHNAQKGRRIRFSDNNRIHEIASFKGQPLWLRPVRKVMPTNVSEIIPVGMSFPLGDFPLLTLHAAYYCAPGTVPSFPVPGFEPLPSRRMPSSLVQPLRLVVITGNVESRRVEQLTLCTLSASNPAARMRIALGGDALRLRVDGPAGAGIMVVASGSAAQSGYIFPPGTHPDFFKHSSSLRIGVDRDRALRRHQARLPDADGSSGSEDGSGSDEAVVGDAAM